MQNVAVLVSVFWGSSHVTFRERKWKRLLLMQIVVTWRPLKVIIKGCWGSIKMEKHNERNTYLRFYLLFTQLLIFFYTMQSIFVFFCIPDLHVQLSRHLYLQETVDMFFIAISSSISTPTSVVMFLSFSLPHSTHTHVCGLRMFFFLLLFSIDGFRICLHSPCHNT